MKKYFLFAIMALAMIVTSCSKQSVNEPESTLVAGEDGFVATIANNSIQNAPSFNGSDNSTMAEFSGKYVNWQVGDKIIVKGTKLTTGRTFTCNQVSGNALFRSGLNNSDLGTPYDAYYPTSIANLSLPATISYNEDSTAKDLPMYAHSDTNSLVFHNLTAALKIMIPATMSDAAKIVISNSGTALNGSFTVSGDGNTTPYCASVTRASAANDTLTITGVSASATVYVPIPAGQYSNFQIVILDSNNDTIFTKQNTNTTTFAVNRLYRASVIDPNGVFYMEAAEPNCTINIDNADPDNIGFKYSTDGINYTPMTFDNSCWTYALQYKGDRLYIKANSSNAGLLNAETSAPTTFRTDGQKFNIGGNILYLINENPIGNETPFTAGCFMGLFQSSRLVDASALKLPSTVGVWCYAAMFYDCKELVSAPILPAVTLSAHCYEEMFMDCYKLATVTILATDVSAENCLADWLKNAGTNATNPTLKVNNAITSTSHTAYSTINSNTPLIWTIKTEDGNTTLRNGQSN